VMDIGGIDLERVEVVDEDVGRVCRRRQRHERKAERILENNPASGGATVSPRNSA
jgi:hypothetical protein